MKMQVDRKTAEGAARVKLYSRPPAEISVRVLKGNASENTTSLGFKLVEYLSLLDGADAIFMTIFMELLIHGKVRVETGEDSERMALENDADMLNPSQAANLLHDFCAEVTHLKQLDKKRSTLRVPVPLTMAKKTKVANKTSR